MLFILYTITQLAFVALLVYTGLVEKDLLRSNQYLIIVLLLEIIMKLM